MHQLRCIILAGTFFAAIAWAQPQPAAPAITRIEGRVLVDGQQVEAPLSLRDQSVVRTEAGRVAVRFGGGSLFLGENSSVRVFESGAGNWNRLEMLDGSAVVTTGAGRTLLAGEDAVTLA